ncbi:hypothetical protein [Acinetobacter sp.]|uniref:hypothetical protein n=1 Tax=Acinetobacter sp. TaxID=472 RepID=UPI0025C48052|nr:hypothetical protein [Acinetobacter sp.]
MNNPAQIKRFIFTGTPDSGKTSVIRELEKFGHAVSLRAKLDAKEKMIKIIDHIEGNK